MKKNKSNVEIIKSFEEYKMKARVRVLEEKINKLYKFGLTFWVILAIIILFFALIVL